MSERLPKWLLNSNGVKTSRAFRMRKRREIRAALQAVRVARIGCAYLPDGSKHIDAAYASLTALYQGIVP